MYRPSRLEVRAKRFVCLAPSLVVRLGQRGTVCKVKRVYMHVQVRVRHVRVGLRVCVSVRVRACVRVHVGGHARTCVCVRVCEYIWILSMRLVC